jgi:hypothetical protein
LEKSLPTCSFIRIVGSEEIAGYLNAFLAPNTLYNSMVNSPTSVAMTIPDVLTHVKLQRIAPKEHIK